MLHKQVALTDATTTDQGEFTAIAAAYSVDRQGDQIVKGAFEDTLIAWQHQGRPIPVHWNHEGDAKNVIGSVDPQTMRETDAGLEVSGQLDLQDSEVAREAWRSMKAGRIALSFGYMVTADYKREDGVRELLSIDLFEVSLTPSPANPDTRILSMKSQANAAFTDSDWEGIRQVETKAPAAHEQRRRDKEDLNTFIAELEAKAEREAKRNRPIHVKRIEVS